VAAADDAALDAERLRQARVQAIGHDNEARRHLLAARQHEDLPVVAIGDAGDLGAELAHAIGNLRADGVDQRIVNDAVAGALLCLQETIACDRHDAIERGIAQDRLGETRLAQELHLRSIELLATEFGRIDFVWVDHRDAVASLAQHGRCGCPRETAADNSDITILHEPPPLRAQARL
jgi:hypothetical protein